jgi:type VI secretion system protein ImpL
VEWISNNLLLLLLGLAALLILVIVGAVLLGLMLQRRDKAASDGDPQPESEPEAVDFRGLSRNAALTVAAGRRRVGRIASLDRVDEDVPWVGLVGLPGAGASALVDNLQLPWQSESPPPAMASADMRIRLLREGVVLDFGDDLLDADDWEQRWRAMVKGVRTQRPNRPLDGLVIAVPMSTLVGPAALTVDALQTEGERLGEMLGAMQAVTGFRVPIYVVLSGAESLPGFARFIADGLDPDLRDGILGWSTPYDAEEVFIEGWIQEGLYEIRRGLEALQTAVLMRLDDDAREARLADDVFTFSRDIQDLDETLAALLLPAMRNSAFQAPAILRGIYLTAGPPAETYQPDLDREDGPRLAARTVEGQAFVRGLFEEKIFREHRLAEPARNFATARHVTVRRLRVALAVAFVLALIGTGYQWSRNLDRTDVFSLLDTIKLAEQRAKEKQFKDRSFNDISPPAVDIIDAMSRLRTDSVVVFSVPTSRLAGVDRTIASTVGLGMVNFIMPALRAGMTRRLERILRDAVQAANAEDAATADQRLMNSAVHLENLVAGLKEFDARIADYNRILVDQTLEPLPRLAAYALYHRPPGTFDPNHRFFQFDKSRYIELFPLPIQKYQDAARQDMDAELGPKIERIYESTPIYTTLMSLSETIQAITQGSTGRSGQGPSQLQLLGLGELIQRARALLTHDRTNWLDTGKLQGAGDINALLGEIGQLSFVSPDTSSDLTRRHNNARETARGEALAFIGIDNRPLLIDTVNGVELAPIYASLETQLAGLLSTPYLSGTPDHQTVPPSSSGSFQWDLSRLQDIMDAIEWRQTVVGDAISRMPAQFGRIVDAFIRAHLEERFEAQVATAQLPLAAGASGTTVRVNAEIRAFTAAGSLLSAVDQGLSLVGYARTLEQLRNAAVPQAERLLAAVDAELQDQAPYELYDPLLTTWDGHGPFAADAFGVGSLAALGSLLSDSRGFVELLAQDQAAPLVNYLQEGRRFRTSMAERLVQKWSQILSGIEAYQAKKPRNDLAMLERFVLSDMDKIDVENCRESTTSQPIGQGFFGQKLLQILQAIGERCATLDAETATVAYATLKRDFDRGLAGRFPFVGIGPRVPLTNFSRVANPVEPTAVRLFLAANGARIETLAKSLAQPEFAASPSGQAAAQFVGSLAAIETAMSPLLAETQPPANLAYRLRFSFRTNAGAGRADEQILEWIVSVAGATISSFGEDDTLVWTQGDPITITLRWARNAPQIPAATQPIPAMVEGPSVSYRYADRWSAFTMLGAHAAGAATLDTLADPTANVLAFNVALQTNPSAAAGLDVSTDTARAFARVDLFPGPKPPAPSAPPEVPIEMPYFPSLGPPL